MNLSQCIKGGSVDGRAGWIIGFDYRPEIVEKLKEIPHTEREWHLDTKVWWISDIYSEHLRKIFPNFEALAYLQGNFFEALTENK